jgi:hypothetical protein
MIEMGMRLWRDKSGKLQTKFTPSPPELRAMRRPGMTLEVRLLNDVLDFLERLTATEVKDYTQTESGIVVPKDKSVHVADRRDAAGKFIVDQVTAPKGRQ